MSNWQNELSRAALDYAAKLDGPYARSLFAAGYRRYHAGQVRNSVRYHAADLALLQEGWDFARGEQQFAEAMYEDIESERQAYDDLAASTRGCW
jgi:hypothetical protein